MPKIASRRTSVDHESYFTSINILLFLLQATNPRSPPHYGINETLKARNLLKLKKAYNSA